jgi:hypothetical protein
MVKGKWPGNNGISKSWFKAKKKSIDIKVKNRTNVSKRSHIVHNNNLPPFISNHEDERASPARRVGDAVVGSPCWTPLLDFKGFATTCSIPIMDSTRRPRLAMCGDGSLANVHIANTHCEYIALSSGFDLEWLTTPLLTPSFNIPESECWDESSDTGEPCIMPELARGLLVETLPSRTTDGLSLLTLNREPIWDETIFACRMYWFELPYPLLLLFIWAKEGKELIRELDWGFQYAAAIDLRCLLWPKAKRDKAVKNEK